MSCSNLSLQTQNRKIIIICKVLNTLLTVTLIPFIWFFLRLACHWEINFWTALTFSLFFFFLYLSSLYKSKSLIKSLDILINTLVSIKEERTAQMFNSVRLNKIRLTAVATDCFLFLCFFSKQFFYDWLEHVKKLLLVRSIYWPFILYSHFYENSVLLSVGSRLLF